MSIAAAPAPHSPKYSIEVISDNICPWCFVGKRRMEAAINKVSASVSVRWLPFFLNPSTPAEGYDLRQYLRDKYGTARFAAIDPANPSNPLNEAGAGVGIKFNYERRVVNTLDSHRLVEYAEKHYGLEKQNEVIEQIFRFYFEEAKDISKIDVLVSIASSCGLDAEKTRQFLSSDEQKTEVFRDATKWSGRISGVPFFIIGAPGTRQKVALNGAQDVETFVDAFEHLNSLTKTA